MSMNFKRRLPIPQEIREGMPLSPELAAKKVAFDEKVARVITGEDPRKLLVIGPCSADREDSVLEYVTRLAEATRAHQLVQLGLSPRGALAVCRMAKAYAYVQGRDYAMPEDVAAIFPDVCCHRLMLSTKARMMERSAEQIVDEILKNVEMPVIRKSREGV